MTSYSRRKNWWSRGQRYRGTAYTYTHVMRAVALLADAGLIEDQRASAGDHVRTHRQSRMRARPALIEAFEGCDIHFCEDVELIRIA